jgi:hypothetical protein
VEIFPVPAKLSATAKSAAVASLRVTVIVLSLGVNLTAFDQIPNHLTDLQRIDGEVKGR